MSEQGPGEAGPCQSGRTWPAFSRVTAGARMMGFP